jgi:hypothetical protein
MHLLILMDSDGFVWTGTAFKWPSCDTPPMTFAPEDALRTAFALAVFHKALLSDGNIEIHQYEPSTESSYRFRLRITHVSGLKQNSLSGTIPAFNLREQYLQWRDFPALM